MRTSRGVVDDSITQNLNALIKPAARGFNPASTSQRAARPLSRQQIDPDSCQDFKDKVLFPAWQVRSDVLSYCALVATSPDPDDPEAAVREAELEKNRESVVDERLDPYSARFFPTEPRTTQLAMLIRQEIGVEKIVRTRTWELVKERCGGSVGGSESAETALASWRRERAA